MNKEITPENQQVADLVIFANNQKFTPEPMIIEPFTNSSVLIVSRSRVDTIIPYNEMCKYTNISMFADPEGLVLA